MKRPPSQQNGRCHSQLSRPMSQQNGHLPMSDGAGPEDNIVMRYTTNPPHQQNDAILEEGEYLSHIYIVWKKHATIRRPMAISFWPVLSIFIFGGQRYLWEPMLSLGANVILGARGMHSPRVYRNPWIISGVFSHKTWHTRYSFRVRKTSKFTTLVGGCTVDPDTESYIFFEASKYLLKKLWPLKKCDATTVVKQWLKEHSSGN